MSGLGSSSTCILSCLVGEKSDPETQENTTTSGKVTKTKIYTSLLANHLPSRILLVYQLLSPIVTNQGNCDELVRKLLTATLVGVCGLLCFLLSFTDSFKDKKGIVRYGIVTVRGLWVIEGSEKLSALDSAKYKLKLVDIVHAFMTLFVFAAVALSDTNVAYCFYPSVATQLSIIFAGLPIGISVVSCSVLMIFPCTRHPLGFPVFSESNNTKF